MRIIDDNGRIFGTINIIDVTVLFFIISLVAGFLRLEYTGDLSRDLDPARKLLVEKNVTVVLTVYDLSILEHLDMEMKRVHYDNETFMKIIKIDPTLEELIERNVKFEKKGGINVTLLLQIKTFHDNFLNKYYYYWSDKFHTTTPTLIVNNEKIPIVTKMINTSAIITCVHEKGTI